MLSVLRYPIKLSLFCLGNTAGVVIVGSSDTALESCHKAEAGRTIVRSRPSIVATDLTFLALSCEAIARGSRL